MKRMMTLLLALAMMLALAACGGEAAPTTPATEAAQSADMQAIYDSLAAQMPEMVVLDETMMLNYCGIAAEDCLQAVVATCADGLRSDEVWLIEAVDADALGRIQELANTRLMMKDEESVTYSPEQNAIVKKAQILTSGQYFALLVSPDVDALVDVVKAAIGG